MTRWPLLTGQNITGQSFAFQWRWKNVSCKPLWSLQWRVPPHRTVRARGALLVRMPCSSIFLGFPGNFWAQPLHYQFLSLKNVALFVFLPTAIVSSVKPLCFYLLLILTSLRTRLQVCLSCPPCWLVTWSSPQGILVYGSFRSQSKIFQFILISVTFNSLRFEINLKQKQKQNETKTKNKTY